MWDIQGNHFDFQSIVNALIRETRTTVRIKLGCWSAINFAERQTNFVKTFRFFC